MSRRTVGKTEEVWFTGSTSFFYTGLSVSVPAKTVYAIDFAIVYANTGPDSILISYSSTNIDPYNTAVRGNSSSKAYVCGYNEKNSPITFYVWGKYQYAGTRNYAEASYCFDTVN